MIGILLVAGWFIALRYVHQTVRSRLEMLNLGEVQIGNLKVTPSGIEASQIKFHQADALPNEPWIEVANFKIRHPLSAWTGEANYFEAVEIDGISVTLNVDSFSKTPNEEFDLRSLTLPSDKVLISNSTLSLIQSDRRFAFSNISAELNNGKIIRFDGKMNSGENSNWTLSGFLNAPQNQFDASIVSKDLVIKTEQWSQWPLLPTDLKKIVALDGTVAANIQFRQIDGRPTAKGLIRIGQVETELKQFGIPLRIKKGQIEFQKGQIGYDEFFAVTPDGGSINFRGCTKTDRWPWITNFEGDIDQVKTNSIRKLVPDLPDILTANVSGPIQGSVRVTSTLATQTDLSATLESSSVRYGQIVGRDAKTLIEIAKLNFDHDFLFQSIDGSVDFDAKFEKLPLDDVFQTLEVQETQKILGLNGRANGQLVLEIPLQTAHQVKTWSANITAESESASLVSQQVHHLNATAKLKDGELNFQSITASTHAPQALETARDLSAEVRLPIANINPRNALVSLKLDKTHADWLLPAVTKLIENVQGVPFQEHPSLKEFDGVINGNVELEFPIEHPEQLDAWLANAHLSGNLKLRNQSLNDIKADLSLNESMFRVVSLSAKNGKSQTIEGNGKWNLAVDDFSAQLNSPSIDAAWLRSLISQNAFGIGEYTERIPDMDGQVKLDVKIESHDKLKTQPEIEISAAAKKMLLGGQQLQNLELRTKFNTYEISIQNLRAQLPTKGFLEGRGTWNFNTGNGAGKLAWREFPLELLQELSRTPEQDKIDNMKLAGFTSGELYFQHPPNKTTAQKKKILPQVHGNIRCSKMLIQGLRWNNFSCDVSSKKEQILLSNLKFDGHETKTLSLNARIDTQSPFAFDVRGSFNQLPLSQIIKPKTVLDQRASIALTGTTTGPFHFSGTMMPFEWETDGEITVKDPSMNLTQMEDISIRWKFLDKTRIKAKLAEESYLNIQAFGGSIAMKEFSLKPQNVKLELSDLDVQQLASVFDLPFKVSGRLNGSSNFERWNRPDSRFALDLTSTSLSVGPKKLGDFRAHAEWKNNLLEYRLDGGLLGGKLVGDGSAKTNATETPIKFPLRLRLTNGTLNGFYAGSNYFRSLRPLRGGVSAEANLVLVPNQLPRGNGRISIANAQWKRKPLTRLASFRVLLKDDRLVIDDAKVDLKRGRINANVVIPLREQQVGTFQVDIRKFDLRKLANLLAEDTLDWDGLVDSRLDGRLGQNLSGRGFIAIDRANLHGVTGQSAKLPISFNLSPLRQQGRIELQRSRFRLFDGTVAGTATVEFGKQTELKTDLQLSNINTGSLIKSVSSYSGIDQGRLSGRLQLAGHDVRTSRDLTGSFIGSLDRTNAFQLPVLQQVGRFLATGNLNNRDFESDEIRFKLHRGQVKIISLNLKNALAQIAITGSLFLDGRIDLLVTARIEQLNQPSLVDELLGSPLARFAGSPTALIGRAAEFLSERVAFLTVKGNLNRPQIRLDSGRQIQAEVVRFFLQDSGLLRRDR